MSSSLQHEKCKMLFTLLILATLSTGIESVTHLVDLPLKMHAGSSMIHATLTDLNGANKYFIQEFISSGLYTKGKIAIAAENNNYNIHYNTSLNYNNERLVTYGANCLIFYYKNKWDQTLPGISKPVTNLILLMGPSILYRLDHSSLVWKDAPGKNIRGTIMKAASTEINKRLKITYYYKSRFDGDSGIKNPARIEFSGFDPSTTSYTLKEDLILDIYLQEENYNDRFANEVQPLPGIGCTHYLSGGRAFPVLQANYVHYTMFEYIQGSTNTQTFSEIHASRKNELLRLKASILGSTTEAIFDYQLGVSFLFSEGSSCEILPADLNSPGIGSNGYFSLNYLFLIDQSKSIFQYLGKLNLEHRSGFPVDAWEIVNYNFNINGRKVDKAVITQYFAQSRDSEIFIGYTLVSTTIAIYKLDSSKNTYTLTDGITRDYLNFETVGFEDELHDVFTLKECRYLSTFESKTLSFRLQCQDNSCTKLTESRVYSMKQYFISSLTYANNVSPLRIDTVQYNFNDEQMEIEVTFLDSPNLRNVFNTKIMSISADTFNKMVKIEASSEFECLETLAEYQFAIMAIVYSPSDSVCGYLRNLDDLKEDTKIGQPCSVYHFPLHNFHRIYKEVPLETIHDVLLRRVGENYNLYDGNRYISYKLIDVIDKTEKGNDRLNDFQSKIKFDAKLNSADQTTMTVPNVKTFSDCYRYCHDSEQLKCYTFSYCQNGDSVDCRVSSLITGDILKASDTHVEHDTKCSIFALAILNEYTEVRHKKFKTQTSSAMDKDLNSCAEVCHSSSDCLSFQFCGSSCSFGGFYTDATTEYDERCSIFHPKVTGKYQKTGDKIITDAIHTEMNLNFEQCASLCHDWSDGDTGCKSFNYCPKSRTESSCSLTQFSVKSSDTKTIEGGDCSNYELKDGSNGKKSKESSSTEVTKGTSSSGAFGIIMLFLFIGVALGFASPFAYIKVKQMRNASEASESFTWKKQENEQLENVE